MTFYEEFNVKLKEWKQKDFCLNEVLSITHEGNMRCGQIINDYLECKRQACPKWNYHYDTTWRDEWLE